MQMRLRKFARERSEEIVVECERRALKTFLLLASVGWLIDGAWIFRELLFANADEGVVVRPLALAILGLSAAALAVSSVWVVFGRRVATFVAGELRVHSTIGPLRVRKTRTYLLTRICDVRLWFQGFNDEGWKTTSWSIVFDYDGRMIVLFPHVPQLAADALLRDTRMHALAATLS